MKQSDIFRENAENCGRLAEAATNQPLHLRYKRMEAAWLALANEQDWLDGVVADVLHRGLTVAVLVVDAVQEAWRSCGVRVPVAVHAHHVRKVDDAAVTFGDDDVVMSDGADRNGLDVAEGTRTPRRCVRPSVRRARSRSGTATSPRATALRRGSHSRC